MPNVTPVHFHFFLTLVFFQLFRYSYFFLFFLEGAEAQQQGSIIHLTSQLSEARYSLAATSSGEIVFFGGGQNATGASDRVDIYNVSSGSWTTAILSIPRWGLAATSLGSLVFFAGGWDGTTYYNQVDIYNISDGSWSTANLSQARWGLAGTSVGSLVLFGGGSNSSGASDVVDIYNMSSSTWTTATLSRARYYIAATAIDQLAFFGGGYDGNNVYSVVDMYDASNGVWSTISLSQGRYGLAATSLGNLTFFGGGQVTATTMSNVVDIFDSANQTWSTASLSQNRTYLAAASAGEIVAFGGGTPDGVTAIAVVDMYIVTNGTWINFNLSQPSYNLAATSANNTIIFGGGENTASTSAVDIFDFVLRPLIFLLPSSPPFPRPTPRNKPPSIESGVSNVTVAIVVGISVLCFAVGFTLLLILLIKRRKRRKGKTSVRLQPSATIVLESAMKSIVVTDTKTIAHSTYQPGTETLKELTPGQIPLNELEIGKEIGNGNYGRVCLGKWKKYRVALKFCQNRAKMDEFLREANLMITLPPHPNVVRMYGVSIDGTQPIIVMEYCAGGSLDKVLYDTEEHISDEQKIRWVQEIAIGMCHLHKHNIVHRDLAARNVLLSRPYSSTTRLKISDFGLSRVLQQDIEGKTKRPFGPIRWMAPESIGQQIYSKKSDVWMFGMLIYEIVAQCEPYTDIDPSEVAVLIRDKGLKPTVPNDCPEKLHELMNLCWNPQPEQRPSFETICEMFEK
jgi:hypothetical protein